jgi:hypothetical protein
MKIGEDTIEDVKNMIKVFIQYFTFKLILWLTRCLGARL